MTTKTKANKAPFTITSAGEALSICTLTDGRVWSEEIDGDELADAATAALAYEANGYEGIQPNEAVRIEQEGAGSDFVARLMIDGKPAGELARDPALSDLLITLEDEAETIVQVEGIREDVNADEDEDERTGSVVPDVFKKRYAEAGHPGHCGDWLALQLNGLCQTMDGKKTITDLDRLEAIANANGVAPARVDRLGTATNGWQGRYRMTVRNMLAKVVADKGFLFIPEGCGVKKDEERKAPKDWCLKCATKAKVKAVVQKDAGAGKPSAKTKALAHQEAPVEGGVVKELPATAGKAKYTNGRASKAAKAGVTK